MITTGILLWWPTSPPYTFRLHPFMDTGFQGAIGRPRPLSPQGLCLLLSALAVLFAQAPAGLRHLQGSGPPAGRSLLRDTTTLRLLRSSYLKRRPSPGTRSPHSASFSLVALSLYKITYLFVCFLCVSHVTLQTPRGQGLRSFTTEYPQCLEQVPAHIRCPTHFS